MVMGIFVLRKLLFYWSGEKILIFFREELPHLLKFETLNPYCAGGGTGRHVRLRGVSRKV
jgi:hypothetical protein